MTKSMFAFVAFGLGALSLAGSALGQSVQALPPANGAVAGNSSNYIPLGAVTGGRILTLYAANQLTGIPAGSTITGMQLRQRNTETTPWPPSALTVTDYEVWMGSSTRTPATISSTFADNMSNAQRVRDGALSVVANAYPGGAVAGSVPEAWGPFIGFQTGYVYTGGVLALELRSTGGGTPTQFADAMTNNADSAGLSTTVSPTNPTGGTVVGMIVRLTFVPPTLDLAQGVTKMTVPDYFVNHSADILNTLINQSARTMVSAAHPNQFDTIGPGSDFRGMSWRVYRERPSWPGAIATFTNYDVQLSRSQNQPGSLSTTVASNVGPDAVTARTGPLSIPPNTFGVAGSEATAPFGFEVDFTTPYQYRSGTLLTVVRHDGQTGGSSEYLDSIETTDPAYGLLVDAYRGTGSALAVTSTHSEYTITRYSVDAGTMSPLNQPAPAPSSVPINFFPNVLQTVIAASELRNIPVGSVIDSLWLRHALPEPSGPESVLTSGDFEVELSSATVQPASMSNTFASNEGTDKVRVHDGAFVLQPNTIPAGSNGNFGKLVQFQKSFVYKGGPLCVTIRHSGLSRTYSGPEALLGSIAINKSKYAANQSATTGGDLGLGFDGIALKLGYIPSVITPNMLETNLGFGGWELPNTTVAAVQVVIAADQLRSVDVGSTITGMSFRSSATTSFPATDTTLARFDVTLGPATHPPLSMSDTFASNMGAGAVAVRSGALTVPANAYPPQDTTPAENAWYVPFGRGYVYTGGDLCVMIRSEGTLSNFGTFDGEGISPSARGAARWNYSNANGVSGSSWGPLGIRWAFTARAFCPWDLNNNGTVADEDFSIFAGAYDTLDCMDPSMPRGCPADFNFDRVVDDLDFSAFVAAYNELLCP